MNLRGIQTLALLLWGYQCELLLFAVPMAAIWESQFFVNRRWALTKKDFYLLSDLTSVCLILLIIFLFLNRAEYHFIRTLMQWLPILLFPLTITVGYSTTDRLKLDALFYSLRKQKQPVTQSWDLDYLWFGFLMVASATSKSLDSLYFPAAGLLVFLALLPLRSSRHNPKVWLLVCTMTFLLALATHTGIRETHLEIRKRAQAWLAGWIQQRTNPLKTHTAIGQIGKLKVSDAILFRIKPGASAAMGGYLQEAVYDLPLNNSWSVMDQDFSRVEAADDFYWVLSPPTEQDVRLKIYHEFKRATEVIPLPPGTTQIIDLPAIQIQQSANGVIQGQELVPSPGYRVVYRPGHHHTAPPTRADNIVPESSAALLREVVSRERMDESEPLLSLYKFFEEFRYSLYQPETIGRSPMEAFLLHRRTGHCEFFASATVLLLRQMGIPARYVTGYAVSEYDEFLDMYVVRQRHAHAWAIAYLDGQWRRVDTTPTQWLELEAEQATLLRPLIDRLSNINFSFQIWWNDQRMEDYENYLYGLGLMLALVLLWRIGTSDQIVITAKKSVAEETDTPLPGQDSPLYTVIARLEAAGFERQPGELISTWFKRIGHAPLNGLLADHYRLRFHPAGLSEEELNRFQKEVERQLQDMDDQDVGKTS